MFAHFLFWSVNPDADLGTRSFSQSLRLSVSDPYGTTDLIQLCEGPHYFECHFFKSLSFYNLNMSDARSN
jgi:hypothetical protein